MSRRRTAEERTRDTARNAPGSRRLDRISRRAHELYEARGGTHGRDLEDWLQAEREVDGEGEGESS